MLLTYSFALTIISSISPYTLAPQPMVNSRHGCSAPHHAVAVTADDEDADRRSPRDQADYHCLTFPCSTVYLQPLRAYQPL